MYSQAALAILLGLPSTLGLVRPDGVGRLPALGWNSWNAYACDIDEDKVLSAAQTMVDNGFLTAGYEYVNVDDCWSLESGRDNVTNQIIPDPTKFPDGISGLADKIHAMGFKSGIYSSAGTNTCAGFPASIFFEDIDAQTFASWGIDYLKYDNCFIPSSLVDEYVFCVPDGSDPDAYVNGSCGTFAGEAPAGYDWSTSNTAYRYRRMRDALEAQDRTILFSLCEWGTAGVETWGNETGNSWRMSGDITADWARILQIMNENSFYLNNVDFWGHNDADMLEVGNGNLTFAESRSHFALWALMKSPLIIGTNLATLSADLTAILLNPTLLAFHQDPIVGKPATPYKWGLNPDWTFNSTFPAQFWSGASSTGVIVGMLNTLDDDTVMEAVWEEVGHGIAAGASYEVTDGWSGASLGCLEGGFNTTVASHDIAILLIGEEC